MEAPTLSTTLPTPIIFGRNEPLTSILTRMTQNFETDILGRMLWYYDQLEISPERKLEIRNRNKERRERGLPEENEVTIDHIRQLDATSCVYTHNAVMSIFFGKWHRDSKSIKQLGKIPQFAIHDVKLIMAELHNRSILTNQRPNFADMINPAFVLDENHWTAYSIQIFANHNKKAFIDHALIILQAKEKDKMTYKILQSYIRQYSFNQHDLTYSLEHIFLLLDEILHYVTATKWDASHSQLFNDFFHSNQTIQQGKALNESRWIKIRWNTFNRKSLERHASEFRNSFPEHYKIALTK